MAAGESGIHLCVFDLDHTLVRSDLDLDRMKRDVASHLRRRGVGLAMGEPLPPIAELLRAAEVHDGRHGSRVAAEVWQIVAEHERRALAAAREEPGARETLGALRARGCWVAVWTNNASATAAEALARAGLAGLVDVLVGRDDAGALKPAPDGFKVILDRLAAVAGCRHARRAGAVAARCHGDAGVARKRATERAIVIGDSWIDGAAASAAGVRFVAFRTPASIFAARGVPVWRRVEHLAEVLHLPGMPAGSRCG
ncbi:MAG TPA: HAD hydrolase-like protein [Thermaerobacter sp.]